MSRIRRHLVSVMLMFPCLVLAQTPGHLTAEQHRHIQHDRHDVSVALFGEPRVISEIREELNNNRITREEAFLQIVSFAYTDENLDGERSPHEFIRCFTPYLIEFEDVLSSDSQQIQSAQKTHFSAEIATTYQYMSPSGRFRLQYDTTGTHAVPTADLNSSGIPDYIERAAEYADSSWNYLVDTLGFEDAFTGSFYPFNILFRQFSGIYGQYPVGSNRIEVHRNFANGFPNNQDSVDGKVLGALKVTIAHELKHVIQWHTSRFRGNAGTFNWYELDATMTEDVVFPTVKDYLNYLNHSSSMYGSVNPRVPGAYFQAPFGIYYGEQFGHDFWVDVWKVIRDDNYILVFDAMRIVANQRGLDFNEEFLRNMAWHYAVGTRSASNFGFDARDLFPKNIMFSQTLTGQNPSISNIFSFQDYSTRFFHIIPDNELLGDALIGISRNNENLNAAVLAYYLDGDVEKHLLHASDYSTFDGVRLNRPWQDIETVAITVANPDAGSGSVQVFAASEDDIGIYRFGDFNLSGNINMMDAEALLSRVTTHPGSTGGLQVGQFIAGDVSGNQTLSAYDVSLILRHLNEEVAFFPVDDLESGFGPAPGWFRNTANQVTRQIAAKSVSASNPETTQSVDIQSDATPTADWQIHVANSPDNDTLSIYLDVDFGQYYSFFTEISYDTSALSFQRIEIPNLSTSDYLANFHITSNSVRVAVSSTQPALENEFAILKFVPLRETTTTLAFSSIEIDETGLQTPGHTFDAQVKPRDPVSIYSSNTLPKQTVLLANYPNPFNPKTTIPFELSDAAHVEISIFDVTGRLVTKLESRRYSPGAHNTVFSAEQLSSGVYIVRMVVVYTQANSVSKTFTRQLLLLK